MNRIPTDVAKKLRLKQSALLKTLRTGLIQLLLESDEHTADAMTEAIFEGLVRNASEAEKQKAGKAKK